MEQSPLHKPGQDPRDQDPEPARTPGFVLHPAARARDASARAGSPTTSPHAPDPAPHPADASARAPDPTAPSGLHVAIIMDGNGRWALARGKPRTAGHRAGAEAVRRTVEAAASLGIGTLTLYAFSSDNWRRPAGEVRALMRLFRAYLARETARCVEQGVRLSVIGRRDRLDLPLRRAIEAAEAATAGGRTLHLRLAVDYSSRDALLQAAGRWRRPFPPSRAAFAELIAEAIHATGGLPDVDLLIRTGGEQRLSDFLLWECAYAELFFTPRLWPDFGPADLEAALTEYRRRERRFGGLGPSSLQATSPEPPPSVAASARRFADSADDAVQDDCPPAASPAPKRISLTA